MKLVGENFTCLTEHKIKQLEEALALLLLEVLLQDRSATPASGSGRARLARRQQGPGCVGSTAVGLWPSHGLHEGSRSREGPGQRAARCSRWAQGKAGGAEERGPGMGFLVLPF